MTPKISFDVMLRGRYVATMAVADPSPFPLRPADLDAEVVRRLPHLRREPYLIRFNPQKP